MSLKRIVVTGGNRGIGKAICEAIVAQQKDAFVYLGARKEADGKKAVDEIVQKDASFADRLKVLQLDVTNEDSVKKAVESVKADLADQKLYAVMNNAGVGFDADLETVVNVNYRGVRRVTEHFAPLLAASGARVAIVSSAAGPMFVADLADEEYARTLTDVNVELERIDAIANAEVSGSEGAKMHAQLKSDNNARYKFSKALVNAYMLYLSRTQPTLCVTSCTPGFIETDMTRIFLKDGKTAADFGMKRPEAGAKAPLHTLFGNVKSGSYYGSDALRSPLHKYRGPGDAEYTEAY